MIPMPWVFQTTGIEIGRSLAYHFWRGVFGLSGFRLREDSALERSRRRSLEGTQSKPLWMGPFWDCAYCVPIL